MFTGLIAEVGTIADVRRVPVKNSASLTRITVTGGGLVSELKTGDSVAVGRKTRSRTSM